MGMLIKGRWYYSNFKPKTVKGEFIRAKSQFTGKIKDDPEAEFPAEADRYHLYISLACPWSCRVYLMHKLKNLKGIVGLSIVDPYMGPEGWHFSENESCIPDTVNHCQYMRELYTIADHEYTGRATVPVLWDKHKNTIVNNESSDIMRIFNSAFNSITTNTDDYYPNALHHIIDTLNEKVHHYVNDGVYRAGFATTQKAYERAYDELFATLDELEALLNKRRYLAGDQLTEADIRLFMTLIRFDPVYHYHFKCNKYRIEAYHNLQNYLRELYQIPAFKSSVNFYHIKTHYYCSHPNINPTSIIPKGPVLSLDTDHDREQIKTKSVSS